MKRNVKKILVLLVLSLVGFTTAFACESPFKRIKGITCELQVVLCAVNEVNDFKPCDEMCHKGEEFEEDFEVVQEKCERLERAAKEMEKKAEQLSKKENLDLADAITLVSLIGEANNLTIEMTKALSEVDNLFRDFLGEESLELMRSEDFKSKVEKAIVKWENKK